MEKVPDQKRRKRKVTGVKKNFIIATVLETTKINDDIIEKTRSEYQSTILITCDVKISKD